MRQIVIWAKLAVDHSLEECIGILTDNQMEVLTFCVETTCFRTRSDIYQQEEELAMALLLSPVIAMTNAFMEYFEEMALGSTSLKPSMWLR